MDTTIITTALFRISSEFYALDQGPWLITAYLLAYNSFLMITAKLSDVWGLRIILFAFNGFFLIFSMACSAAQSMNQLYDIVFQPRIRTDHVQNRLPGAARHRRLGTLLARIHSYHEARRPGQDSLLFRHHQFCVRSSKPVWTAHWRSHQ